jgi:tRNA (guanosine-2'-O-)-methyltransferase
VSRNLGGTDLKRLHRQWRRRTSARVALILEGVQSPFNVGSIVRTAAAMSVEQLWLVGDVPSPAGAKVQKTALGTHRYLTWTTTGIDTATDSAREAGFSVVGVELAEGATPLHELDLAGDVCLVVGHEDRGLTREAHDRCDTIAFIPQLGKVGSLNVATAAALAIYEVRRQEWTAQPPD